MHTILGINGTVGPYLAADLKKRNIPVRGVSRRPFEGDWEHRKADVLNLAELIDAVDGSEVVYLVVGLPYDIKVWRRDWPIVMSNTIEACLATGAKLVFLDNVYAYGLVKGEMTEETPYNPCSEKGKVRVQIANMLMEAVEKKNLRACIARGADFFGPRADLSVITSTVTARHAKGLKAQWMGDPKKVHTFTYSKDIGLALAVLGTDAGADGQIWHLPTSSELWTGEQWISESAGQFGAPKGYQAISTFMMKLIGLFVPIMRELAEMNYQFSNDYIFSSEKFERTFGLKPTPNQQGMRETTEYYKNQASGR